VYKLRGKRYKRFLKNREMRYVYIFDVGSGVISEAVKVLREMSILRHGEYWVNYFDFVSRQVYFPRASGLLVAEIIDLKDESLAEGICVTGGVPDYYVEGLVPDGGAEASVKFGRYTMLLEVDGKTFVGMSVGSNFGAICFKHVESVDGFLFHYDYCTRTGRCTDFVKEEAEDALRLLNCNV